MSAHLEPLNIVFHAVPGLHFHQAHDLPARIREEVRLPGGHYEPFYRFLLTLNDQTVRGQRYSLDGDVVYLGFSEAVALLNEMAGADIIDTLIRSAPDARRTLADAFEAKPVY